MAERTNYTELLNDPNTVTLSMTEACHILGISTALASNMAKTGQLCDGVPIIRVGRRAIISARQLRAVLGWPEPTSN